MSRLELGGRASSVEFHAVTKRYGKSVTAVDDVSLRVEAGELVTLLGPSGCGKTTTLRMIAGLEMASAGRILIGESDVTQLPATDRDVSMVFQSYALFPHMTVEQNVTYGLLASKVAKPAARERAHETLELVGLTGFDARLPSELSGGQQQRVAVARALVLQPQVLLFDEPLSNLDAKLRRQVRDDIRDIQMRLGLTVIYVTHDQEEALAVSDRIIVMNEATIAQIGRPRDLYDRPADAFVADFIGEANIVDVTIEDVVAGRASVSLSTVRLDLDARDLAPGPARLAVRPGRVELLPEGSDGTLQGRIEKSTYVGRHMEYRIGTDVGTLFVVSDDMDRLLEVGQTIGVAFGRSGPVLLPT